jgi:hypothetical protein
VPQSGLFFSRRFASGVCGVDFRIEYFRAGVKVMGVPCPKKLREAELIAREGLRLFKSDNAHILDMDDGGKVVATVDA